MAKLFNKTGLTGEWTVDACLTKSRGAEISLSLGTDIEDSSRIRVSESHTHLTTAYDLRRCGLTTLADIRDLASALTKAADIYEASLS